MFSPELDICFVSCNLIRFVDITNVYNATTNRGGWGVPNEVSNDLTSAEIIFQNSEGNTLFTYDVTSQVPNPVTGDFIFTDYEYTLEDGEYTVIYNLEFSSNNTYSFQTTICNTCNFECCINKLIASIPEKLCENKCDTEYIDEVLLIEGLFYGYLCSSQCDKETIKNEIESRLERFCDFQCNC